MQQTSGLARLVGSLKDLDGAAGALADRLTSSKQSLAQEMATTTTIIETVEKTRDALRQVNQQMMTGDNGGPAGPLPDSLPPPAPSSAPARASLDAPALTPLPPQGSILTDALTIPADTAAPPIRTQLPQAKWIGHATTETPRPALTYPKPPPRPGDERDLKPQAATVHAPPSHPPQPHLAAGGFETTNTIRNRQ